MKKPTLLFFFFLSLCVYFLDLGLNWVNLKTSKNQKVQNRIFFL